MNKNNLYIFVIKCKAVKWHLNLKIADIVSRNNLKTCVPLIKPFVQRYGDECISVDWTFSETIK